MSIQSNPSYARPQTALKSNTPSFKGNFRSSYEAREGFKTTLERFYKTCDPETRKDRFFGKYANFNAQKFYDDTKTILQSATAGLKGLIYHNENNAVSFIHENKNGEREVWDTVGFSTHHYPHFKPEDLLPSQKLGQKCQPNVLPILNILSCEEAAARNVNYASENNVFSAIFDNEARAIEKG